MKITFGVIVGNIAKIWTCKNFPLYGICFSFLELKATTTCVGLKAATTCVGLKATTACVGVVRVGAVTQMIVGRLHPLEERMLALTTNTVTVR